VLNHVCLHQTIIGEECIKQMAIAGETPDVVVGCIGGGSNFAGIAFPYVVRRSMEARSAFWR
jgi:tryptophan synthase beta chain